MNKTKQIVHFYNVAPLIESAQVVGEAIHSETNSVKKGYKRFYNKVIIEKS